MRTLGFDVARWMAQHLPSPGDLAAPLALTDAQMDLLADWYAVDERGRFLYRRGALQEAKGWGKSPLAALIGIAELTGPVVFDGWTIAGEPVGRAPDAPLVQICALSEEQADANVHSLIFELLRASDRAAARALGIDENRGMLHLRGRAGKLEPVTSAADSREGQRVTFALLEESHLWTRRNGGQAVARTIRRNAAKIGGRTLEASNAPELGLGSVAEATLDDVARGEPGILLRATRPSRTPEPDMDDAELLALLGEVYAGAPWVDRERILAEVRDAATPWDEAARYYFNVPGGGASVLVEPSRWAELAHPREIAEGARVALGFDGSHSHDGTALVAVDEDGHLSLELLIERDAHDPPDWTVPRPMVDEALRDLFARFDVVALFCDPFHWRAETDAWAREYGSEVVISFPTNSVTRFGPAVDRFRAAVAAGTLSHDADPDLTRHVLNARLVRGRGRADDDGHALYLLEKPGAGRLIDAAVASVLAGEAMAHALREQPPAEPERVPLVAWA